MGNITAKRYVSRRACKVVFPNNWTSDRLPGIGTPGHLTLNLVFILSLSTCAYNFVKAVKMDPGWTRSDLNEEQLTEVRHIAIVSIPPR
jgi:hypothetical protein